MALSKSLLTPQRGNLSSLVSWMLDRKYAISEVIGRAKKKFGRYALSTIEAIANYYVNAKKAANNLRRSGDNRVIGDVVTSSRSVRFSEVRVKATIIISGIPGRKDGEFGFSFDLPKNLTKKQLYEQILNKICDWLFSYYSIRDKSCGGKRDAIKAMVINSIEGL